jgi:DNA modification methylase
MGRADYQLQCESSRPGDLVLDPSAGSGTTLIAAEKSGRVARLIELDPRDVDVIVQRWEAWTGQTAVRSGSQPTAPAA